MPSSNEFRGVDSRPLARNRYIFNAGQGDLRAADFGGFDFTRMSDGPGDKIGAKPVAAFVRADT